MKSEEFRACTQPPDKSSEGPEEVDMLCSRVPSTEKDKENMEDLEEQMGEKSQGKKGKSQKNEGFFSGNISLKQRVEDWMIEEEVSCDAGPKKPLSYRDAVKPKLRLRGTEYGYEDNVVEEEWDGSLLLSGMEDIEKGIKSTDTEKGPSLEFSEEERRRLERYWKNSLIIKILGGTVRSMLLKKKLQLLWGKGEKVELLVIGNGYMIASFQSQEDYYFALEGGPWLVQNHYLTIQTWKRNFDPWNEGIKRVAVWVRLPGLPVDYYDKKFFFHLGNKMGKAVKVDEMTLTRARTMYARMCVEVDINTPLLPSYSVDGQSLKIEYEGLNLICFHCGRFGHAMEHCAQRKNSKELQGTREEEEVRGMGLTREAPMKSPTGNYGEWMIAQEPRRGRRPMAKESKVDRVGKKGDRADMTRMDGASRFAILATKGGDREVNDEGREDRRPLDNISNKLYSQRDEETSAVRKNSKLKASTKETRGTGRKEKEVGSTRELTVSEEKGRKEELRGKVINRGMEDKGNEVVENRSEVSMRGLEKNSNWVDQEVCMGRALGGSNGLDKRENSSEERVRVESLNTDQRYLKEEVVLGSVREPPDLMAEEPCLGLFDEEQMRLAHNEPVEMEVQERDSRCKDRSPERRYA